MEGNFISGSPPAAAAVCGAIELSRWNSGASTLTAEICENVLHRSPNESTTWTDEKHSSYLEHLEVSFVKQLHQSISLFAQGSNHDEGDKDISKMHPINAPQSFEQLAAPVRVRWEKVNYDRGDPLAHVSVDSLSHIKRPWVHRIKRIGTKCPTTSACTPETSSQQFSPNDQYCDSHDSVKEGTGQNFADEDETNSISKSQLKRLKTLLRE